MINTYTVTFFGHRQIENLFDCEKILTEFVEKMIREKEYVEFLVGRNGDFDILTASVIRRAKKKLGGENSALTLVLPYVTAEYLNNRKSFEEYYDEIEIFDEPVHFKNAIQKRNRSLVDRADEIIFYLERESGGAYRTFRYAEKQNKTVKNIFNSKIYKKL